MTQEPLAGVIACMLRSHLTPDMLVETLQNVRLENIARILHYRIAGMQQPSQRDACLGMLNALSELQALRLLCSPALCEALRTNGGDDGIVKLLASACDAGKEDKKLACAPRLACGVALDLSLPDQLRFPSAGLWVARSPSGEELSATVKHLDGALSFMAQMHPFGHQIFTRLVSNIVVRHDAGRPQDCWGASSGIAIGRVVIVNALAQPDARVLGEILLHEATHCAIDCAELHVPLWRTDELANEAVFLTSPWSGNELTAHAFAHACIVWAVLLHYWTACQQHYGVDTGSQARRAYIEKGFRKLEREMALRQALAPLSSKALQAVTLAVQSTRL